MFLNGKNIYTCISMIYYLSIIYICTFILQYTLYTIHVLYSNLPLTFPRGMFIVATKKDPHEWWIQYLNGMEFNGILFFSGCWQLKDFWIFSPWFQIGFMIQFWRAYFSLGLVFRQSLLIETPVAIYSTDPELIAPVPSLCPMQLKPLRPSFASCAAHGATLERDCKFSRRWEGHLNGMVPSVFVWFSKIILVVLYVLLNYVYINLCILMIFREIDTLFICHVCTPNMIFV